MSKHLLLALAAGLAFISGTAGVSVFGASPLAIEQAHAKSGGHTRRVRDHRRPQQVRLRDHHRKPVVRDHRGPKAPVARTTETPRKGIRKSDIIAQ